MNKIKKLMITLVALLAVTTGAWADETLLLTIENKDNTTFYSGSKTFDDKVTVTFSNEVYNNGDASGWYGGGTASLLTVAGINGYTITSCKFYTDRGTASTGYTVQGESPSVYLFTREVFTDANQSVYLGDPGITKIEVYGTAPSASSGPEVAWNKAEKTGTFTMPGGNVTLEPEYYPQAALTAAPTAINDVPATTDGAIVKAGTVANIGSTETAQGTVMYYVSTTALDDAALLALAADQWTADVPTAEKLTEGKAYVYYYVRGNDSDTDEENFSDGDILSANALTVTIAAEPTYAVTFAEGTDPNEWTASPNTGVTKGETVTVTYTGPRKVMGVKAEKKAVGPAEGKIYTNLQGGEVLHVGDKITETEGKFRYTHHSNPQSTDYYTYIRSFNTYEVLRADVAYEGYNYKYTESPDGQYYVLKHTYYDDYEEEWFTAYYFNHDAGYNDSYSSNIAYGYNIRCVAR